MSKVISAKDVKTVSGGVTQGKVLLHLDTLNGVAVLKDKAGEGIRYSLPKGSYYKDTEKQYTRPLYPKDAAGMKTAIEAIMNGDTEKGAWYPAKVQDEKFLGYAAVKDVDIWVDVAVSAEGRLLMPTEVELDEKGEKKYTQVIPLKKDDPIRGEILTAISEAAAS